MQQFLTTSLAKDRKIDSRWGFARLSSNRFLPTDNLNYQYIPLYKNGSPLLPITSLAEEVCRSSRALPSPFSSDVYFLSFLLSIRWTLPNRLCWSCKALGDVLILKFHPILHSSLFLLSSNGSLLILFNPHTAISRLILCMMLLVTLWTLMDFNFIILLLYCV